MLKDSLQKENQPSKMGQKGADPSGLIPSTLPRPGDLAGAKKTETKNPAPPNRGTSPAADGVGAGRHWRLARAAHAAVLPWEASSRALASLVRLLAFFSSLANRSGSSSSPHSESQSGAAQRHQLPLVGSARLSALETIQNFPGKWFSLFLSPPQV